MLFLFCFDCRPLRDVFPDWVYYAWSPASNEVQEGVSKILDAVLTRGRWRNEGDVVTAGQESGMTTTTRTTRTVDRYWRWSGVNTLFAISLTVAGVLFTVAQARVLARVHREAEAAEEEERKRSRRRLHGTRSFTGGRN